MITLEIEWSARRDRFDLRSGYNVRLGGSNHEIWGPTLWTALMRALAWFLYDLAAVTQPGRDVP